MGSLIKDQYVYYHREGCKDRKRNKYVRELLLGECFEAALRRIRVTEDVLSLVKKALLDSHTLVKRDRGARVAALQREYDRLAQKIDAAYEDRLEGRIDVAFFDLVSSLPDRYAAAEAGDKRALLSRVVSNAVWRDGKLEVTLKKAFQLLENLPPDPESTNASGGLTGGVSEDWYAWAVGALTVLREVGVEYAA